MSKQNSRTDVVKDDPVPMSAMVKDAMNKYASNFWKDNTSMCLFWFPADIILYSGPVWLRLPLNHAISFVWCSVMSVWKGGKVSTVESEVDLAQKL